MIVRILYRPELIHQLKMDSSDDCEERSFSFNDLKTNKIQFPLSISVSGIHRAVLEGDLHKVRRWIESGQSVNSQEIHYNFSPLHLAVIYNNLQILDYLLTREDIQVDVECSKGRTPLFVAVAFGHIESVEKLIQAESNVNIADSDNNTALHLSVVGYSHICHLLLRHGAQLYNNNSGENALNDAVIDNNIETVCMLLYYNVDANFPDQYNCSPFMTALQYGHEEIQAALLEYVDDFNRNCYFNTEFNSTLHFALESNSPFIKDIIERGANVNYGDDPTNTDGICAFYSCLLCPVDLTVFKMVWDRLRYNYVRDTIDLLGFLDFTCEVPEFLQVIIESDNFEPAAILLSKGMNYYSFVNKFAEEGYDLDQLTTLTCRLLECGFRPTSYNVHAVLTHYGYCELFRILLYMDHDFSPGWLPHMALTRLIFDVNFDLKSVIDNVNQIPKKTILQLSEYCICPPLIDALILKYGDDESMSAILSSLPRVPSLIELARNGARKQIWRSFKISNNCQFYTTIDHLGIPILYKNILTFTKKLYRVQ